ncbi:MAG: hypothetical protein KC425_14820 [Anaerolineales bacterium]|nr:hypothetical protein [Anaerolineales bacterium]
MTPSQALDTIDELIKDLTEQLAAAETRYATELRVYQFALIEHYATEPDLPINLSHLENAAREEHTQIVQLRQRKEAVARLRATLGKKPELLEQMAQALEVR